MRRNPRARRNMAYPKLAVFPDGTTMEVDDAEEAADARARGANIRSMASAGRAAPATPARRATPTRTVPARGTPQRARGGRGRRGPVDPDKMKGPMTYNQADKLKNKMGGINALCPGVSAAAQRVGAKLSAFDFLRAFVPALSGSGGKALASRIITTMESKEFGLDQYRYAVDSEEAQLAQEIFFEMTGATCPTDPRFFLSDMATAPEGTMIPTPERPALQTRRLRRKPRSNPRHRRRL